MSMCLMCHVQGERGGTEEDRNRASYGQAASQGDRGRMASQELSRARFVSNTVSDSFMLYSSCTFLEAAYACLCSSPKLASHLSA
jgi:hypothetical protein